MRMKKLLSVLLIAVMTFTLAISLGEEAPAAEPLSAEAIRNAIGAYRETALKSECLASDPSEDTENDESWVLSYSFGSMSASTEKLTEKSVIYDITVMEQDQEVLPGMKIGMLEKSLLNSFRNDNACLAGDYYGALVYLDGDPENGFNAAFPSREGQRNTYILYQTVTPNGDMFDNVCALCFIDGGVVNAIELFAADKALSPEDAAGAYSILAEYSDKDEYIAMHDCGACTEFIAEEYAGKFDLTTTISTACSSAANAVILGANLILSGVVDMAVVGGTECLSKFHLNGFNTLMILDRQPCRPFDAERQGLNLGEGAAYLVLETSDTARERNVKPLCKISGYGNACDAFHQTATSPNGEGAFLAMSKALAASGLKPNDIDYINAHGTGRTNNDLSEGTALERVFGAGKVPPVSSTKCYTGHTTSASGGIESVISILALLHNFCPVNLNFKERIEGLSFSPVTEAESEKELHNVLSNSFGFGGNDSSLIFSKIEPIMSPLLSYIVILADITSDFKYNQ